jgi:hypothetical protein
MSGLFGSHERGTVGTPLAQTPSSAAAAVTGVNPATAIENIIVYNTDSAAHTFTAAIVPSGGSYGDASNIVLCTAVSIPAKGVFSLRDVREPEIELGVGDAIYTVADAASHLDQLILGS